MIQGKVKKNDKFVEGFNMADFEDMVATAIIDYPLLGLVYSSIRRVKSSFLTAAITPTNEMLVGKMLQKIVVKKDTKQFNYVTYHELLHKMHNHFEADKERDDRTLQNMAMDVAINQVCRDRFGGVTVQNELDVLLKELVIDYQLPDFSDMGLSDAEIVEVQNKATEGVGMCTIEAFLSSPKYAPLIAAGKLSKPVENETWEYYYDWLLEAKDASGEGEDDEQQEGGSGGSDGEPQDGDGDGDGGDEDTHAPHRGDGKKSKDQSEYEKGQANMNKDNFEKTVKDAVDRHNEKMRQQGNNMNTDFDFVFERKRSLKQRLKDWKSSLSNVVKSERSYTKQTSLKRPSRRNEANPFGSTKRKETRKFAVIADTSGSMMQDLNRVLNTLLEMSVREKFEMDIYLTDTNVYKQFHGMTSKNFSIKQITEGMRTGGTDLTTAQDIINSQHNHKTSCIVITDGYTGWKTKADGWLRKTYVVYTNQHTKIPEASKEIILDPSED